MPSSRASGGAEADAARGGRLRQADPDRRHDRLHPGQREAVRAGRHGRQVPALAGQTIVPLVGLVLGLLLLALGLYLVLGAGARSRDPPHAAPPRSRSPSPEPVGPQRRCATKIAVPGSSRPRSGDQPPQTCVVDRPATPARPGRPGRSPAADERPDAVAERPVVLDVGRPRRSSSRSTYGRAVEVRAARDQALRARVVREAPSGPGGSPRRPSGRRAAAPGRPRACSRGASATNGTRAVRRAGEVERLGRGTAAPTASAWTAGTAMPVSSSIRGRCLASWPAERSTADGARALG